MKLRSLASLKTLLLVTLVVSAIAGYWSYQRNGARLIAALRNSQSCARLAAEIEQLRQAPQRARLTSRSIDDQGTAVEKAAADAHVARDRVLRIDPQPAKRLGKSDYLEQVTELEMLPISLRQLVDLIFNLQRGDAEVAINTLRLRTPHEGEQPGQELWLADAVLTQRIYAPTTARGQ